MEEKIRIPITTRRESTWHLIAEALLKYPEKKWGDKFFMMRYFLVNLCYTRTRLQNIVSGSFASHLLGKK